MTLEKEVKEKAPSEQSSSSESCCESNIKPSWLMSTLSELDERMKKLDLNMPGDNNGGTFKERAEFYFEKRPELLALLKDLYNGYISLSDRYTQTLIKQNPRHQRQSFDQLSSTDSTSSYHQFSQTHPLISNEIIDYDSIVAEFVIKNVEFDVLLDEVSVMEKKCNESSRKIKLQNSLLEILDSERVMLINENAKLCHEVPVLVEQNKKLASESFIVKKKASEMAKSLSKRREEQTVSLLSRKIDGLQKKIEKLEKKNEYYEHIMNNKFYSGKVVNKNNKHEYYEQVVTKQHRPSRNLKKTKMKMRKKNGGVVLKLKNGHNLKVDESHEKKVSKWWGKVKNMHLFLNLGCKPTFS